MKTDIYAFLARAVLTEHALDLTPRMQHYANSLSIEKEIAAKLPYPQLEQKHLSVARRMAAVFVAIATFENMIRDFVDHVMTEDVGQNWWVERAPDKLKKKVEDRISKESKVPWHTTRGTRPLNYTDFGDLSDLMISLWESFNQDVQDQGRLKSAFTVIELSRNACMHGGSISDRDIERVGMLMRDWLEQLGLG
jgi:hypothetical protein